MELEGSMLVWGIVALVFGAGCVGGLVNSLVAGELQLPRLDKKTNVYRPGWVGSCLVGGIAAVTFWGLYGPLAEATLVGAGSIGASPALKVGELFGSLVTGLGGGRLLLSEVERRAATNQRDALVTTKNELSDAIAKLSGHLEGRP